MPPMIHQIPHARLPGPWKMPGINLLSPLWGACSQIYCNLHCIYIFVTTTTKNHHHILKGCTFTTCLSYISDNGAYVRSVVIPVAVTVVVVLLITMALILAIVSSLMWSRSVTLLHGIDTYNLACIFVMISSSFNTLLRAADKIQYKAEAK